MKTNIPRTTQRPATRYTITNLLCSPAVLGVLAALAGWHGAEK